MKCPHCEEDLGLNNICINPICSYFGSEIKLSNNSSSEDTNTSIQNTSDSRDSNINDSIKYNPNVDPAYISSNYAKRSIKTEHISTITNNISNTNNISKKDFFSFIGSNSTYYLKFIEKLENGSKFSSWNWPCFFLNWYWLLYRKLYVPAIILIAVNFASAKLFGRNSYLVIALLIRIVLAIYANSIYLNNCTRKINIIKETSTNLSENEYINKLRKKGGVTLLWPIVALILSIIGSIIYIMVLFSSMTKSPHFSGSYYL